MKKYWTSLVVMALSLAPTMTALAGGTHVEGGLEGHHGMSIWGGFFFGPIMMILTLAVIVGVVVVMLRWLGVIPSKTSHRDALDG